MLLANVVSVSRLLINGKATFVNEARKLSNPPFWLIFLENYFQYNSSIFYESNYFFTSLASFFASDISNCWSHY